MRTIAIINQKGGVGKTTTVTNLSAAVAGHGREVCLIDLDPQSHLTLHYGFEPEDETPTVFDVMAGESTVEQAAPMIRPFTRLIPATTDLAAAESELASRPNRNDLLRDSLMASPLDHEFVMIDCPPALGLLTLNALVAADEVVIPLQPHFLALQGLSKLLKTIDLVQQRLNPRLRVAGVLLCMYESVTRLARDVVADVEGFFNASRNTGKPWANARIFKTVIRRNIKLAECPSYGQTIFEYDPRSNGAADYASLGDEFVTMFPPPAQSAGQNGLENVAAELIAPQKADNEEVNSQAITPE